jgi:long-chain acyl-CoA synthetase
MSLAERFDMVRRAVGGRPAIVADGGALSYERLGQWSEVVAGSLDRSRSVSGRRVALVLPNGGAFVAAFLGAARSGAVVAPLNPGYRRQEVEHYLADMGPAAVVVCLETAPLVGEALSRLAEPPRLLLVGDPGTCEILSPGGGAGGPDPVPAWPSPPLPSPPLLLLYTSGSTGPPKRVIRTHAQLLAEIDALSAVFAVTPGDRFLGAVPFSHVNGLVRSMLTATLGGASLYPVRHFARRTLLELVGRERLTFFGAVPPMIVMLARTRAREREDLSTLRLIFSASAPLIADDTLAFRRAFGIVVRQLYGSTETGTISFNDHPRPEQHLESVGRALPGVRLAVLDESGRPLPPGVEGEITVSSPFAVTGYDGNEAATGRSFRDGVYLTGDLGRIDEGGTLTLTGRKSFMINRGGYKVNPYEVEQAIRRHPKVADVTVLGAPGPHGDQVVRCLVVSREPCTAEEIARHCREWIADYKIPSHIEFHESLPRTVTGKIRRDAL